MDGYGEHYTKRNESGNERQIPYDLIYKWNLVNKTKEQNRTGVMEIRNKLTVSRGDGGDRKQGKEGEEFSQGTSLMDPW